MQLTLHATRRTSHAASILGASNVCLIGENPTCSICGDARVHWPLTTAMHDMRIPLPPQARAVETRKKQKNKKRLPGIYARTPRVLRNSNYCKARIIAKVFRYKNNKSLKKSTCFSSWAGCGGGCARAGLFRFDASTPCPKGWTVRGWTLSGPSWSMVAPWRLERPCPRPTAVSEAGGAGGKAGDPVGGPGVRVRREGGRGGGREGKSVRRAWNVFQRPAEGRDKTDGARLFPGKGPAWLRAAVG